jgi:carbamate kinase
MLPKVMAAVEYVERGPGRTAVIGALEKAPEAMAGRSGTLIHA